MDSPGTSYFVSHLMYQAPTLVVFLAACVLALVFMGRAPLASILTLCGAGAGLLGTLGVMALQTSMFQSQFDGAGDRIATMQRLGTIGLIGSGIRALALGLIVAAVFVGRSRRDRAERMR